MTLPAGGLHYTATPGQAGWHCWHRLWAHSTWRNTALPAVGESSALPWRSTALAPGKTHLLMSQVPLNHITFKWPLYCKGISTSSSFSFSFSSSYYFSSFSSSSFSSFSSFPPFISLEHYCFLSPAQTILACLCQILSPSTKIKSALGLMGAKVFVEAWRVLEKRR